MDTENQIFSGSAETIITPYIGIDLTGFGGRNKGCTGINDDLYCKAVVLKKKNIKIAIVSCDLLFIRKESVDSIKKEISSSMDIKEENIMIAATHTHSGPAAGFLRFCGDIDETWMELLEKKIVGVIKAASENLHKTIIKIGQIECDININRREIINGNMELGINPDGPVDRMLNVIFFKKEGGGSVGSIIHYACHPVVFGGGNYLISRDFPGYAVDVLEKELGGSVLFLNGACGNINPLRKTNDKIEVKALGKMVGIKAYQSLVSGEVLSDFSLGSTIVNVDLPLGDLPTKKELNKLLSQNSGEINNDSKTSMTQKWEREALNEREKGVKEYRTIEVQGLKVGNLRFFALPGEVFVEYSQFLKSLSTDHKDLLIGYANGCYGYIPTRTAFTEGGYEVEKAYKLYGVYPYSPDIEKELRAGIAKTVDSL